MTNAAANYPDIMNFSHSAGAGSCLRAGAEAARGGPLALLEWVRGTFGDDVILTSSFGAESALMLHLVKQVLPRIVVVFVDTGYLFPETYQFMETLRERFQLDVRVYGPSLTTARLEAVYGRLWEGDPAELSLYQELTKVEPMQRALAELRPRAWLAGLRRSQTSHRAGLEPVVLQGSVYKVHPILGLSDEEVLRDMEQHALPHHPLYRRGYRSIGDVHSTFPTLEGQHSREGRRLGPERECGLHTRVGGAVGGPVISTR